mmetsp:Transcript_27023/g.81031  ORF Transcript_27023/g.81031 Transcript_27023/m.81031 type:complete len:565 (+) Transcript_27023:80-1774(+)
MSLRLALAASLRDAPPPPPKAATPSKGKKAKPAKRPAATKKAPPATKTPEKARRPAASKAKAAEAPAAKASAAPPKSKAPPARKPPAKARPPAAKAAPAAKPKASDSGARPARAAKDAKPLPQELDLRSLPRPEKRKRDKPRVEPSQPAEEKKPEKRERPKNPDIDLAAFGWTPPAEELTWDGMLRRLRAVVVPRTHARENIMHPEDEDLGVRSACIGLVSARAHGVVASDFARRRPCLTRELVRFGRAHLPKNFKFTSIQLNHNFASALHVDDYNAGPSWICGLGNYSGGALWTLDHGPLDCKRQFCHYDGTEPHATLPFQGERYTLVFFSNQSHPRLGDEDRAYLTGLGFPLPSPRELLRNRAGKVGYSCGSYEPPKRVKTQAGEASFRAHLAGRTVDEARAAGDRVFDAWRLEDAREATPEQKAIQGRVFRDEGTRWRVRDAAHRGVYYDLELKQLCVEYYDYDAYGDEDPGNGDDVVEFTPLEELQGFAEWCDHEEALAGDAREQARAEAARRLDAKRAFEAADDAMDAELERDAAAAKEAVEAARAARGLEPAGKKRRR